MKYIKAGPKNSFIFSKLSSLSPINNIKEIYPPKTNLLHDIWLLLFSPVN
jgi:hypothetical protein